MGRGRSIRQEVDKLRIVKSRNSSSKTIQASEIRTLWDDVKGNRLVSGVGRTRDRSLLLYHRMGFE